MKTRLFTFVALVALFLIAVPVVFAGVPNPLGDNVWQGKQLDLTKVQNPVAGSVLFAHGDIDGDGSCDAWVFETAVELNDYGMSNGTWRLWEATPEEVADMIADLGACTLNFTPVDLPAPTDPITPTAPISDTALITATTTVTPTMAPTGEVDMFEAMFPDMPDDTPAWVVYFLRAVLPMAMSYQMPVAPASGPVGEPGPMSRGVYVEPEQFEVEEGAVMNREFAVDGRCEDDVAKMRPILVTSNYTPTVTAKLEDVGRQVWAADDNLCIDPDSDQMVAIHGDVTETGVCNVYVGPLNSPDAPNFGGTSRVYAINGDPHLAATYAQWVAEHYHGETCEIYAVVEPGGG